MNKTISTIIPFYNSMNTLSKMLDSILDNTLLPYEILLIDDGSTDASAEIAKGYAARYPFIKVLSQEHKGVSAARNLGLSKAQGHWISFLDADDYIEPDMYEFMLNAIDSAQISKSIEISGCICGYYTHKEGIVTPICINETTIFDSKELLSAMFTDDSIRGFIINRLFRADHIKNFHFSQHIKICEDMLFQTDILSSEEMHFVCIPTPLYHYIQSPYSLTGTTSFFENQVFIYAPVYEQISHYIDADLVLRSYNSILDFSMYTLLKHYKESKDSKTITQIRLLQKEMLKTKSPFWSKGKRRLAYEFAPLILSHFIE